MSSAVTWLPAGDDVQQMIRKVIDDCYPGQFANQQVVAVFRDDPKWKNAASFHPVPKWCRLLTLPPDEIEAAREEVPDRMEAALQSLAEATKDALDKHKAAKAGEVPDDGEESPDDTDDGPELDLGVCYVVEIRLDWWASNNGEMREALIDHELFHRVKRDHDIMEFAEVAARRPCLKRDIDKRVEVKAQQMAFKFGDPEDKGEQAA